MDRATNILTLLGALIAATVIIIIGQPASGQWWLGASGAIAWALCPYAVMWLLNNVLVEEHRQRDMVLLITVLVMVVLECVQIGMVVYNEMQESLAGLLHNLPVIQLIIAVAGGALAYLMPVVKPKNKSA